MWARYSCKLLMREVVVEIEDLAAPPLELPEGVVRYLVQG